jgi:protein involved in polysaccharide export with SLBB domain
MNDSLKKFVAVGLCCQPVFWMSSVALAQTLPSGGTNDAAGFQSELRLERQAILPGLPPVDRPIDPDAYVVGPGDVLELNFWGLQNLKLKVTVDLEGRAFVPKIGYLALKGQALTKVRQALRDSVARYYPQLGFDLSLVEPRTFLVQAAGDVAKPGSHSARAVDRVAAFLERAGGLGSSASSRRIEIRRASGAVLQVDLALFQLTGEVRHNPFLLDGDVVYVPYESLTARVVGAVNRPGRFELVATRNLAELVMLAGGLSPAATREMPVTLVRRTGGDTQELTLLPFAEDGELPDFPVQQDDVLRFPSFDELQHSVMVIGAVAGVNSPDEASATKRLAYVEGDTVRTLLERLGGVGPVADLAGSYLQRGAESVPVDLYSLIMLRDLTADKPVRLGDTLVIPFKRRNILVVGAVFVPGQYPYNPKLSVEQYLALAGGRNRFALDLDEVRLVTANGETRAFRKDLQVEPGAALVVPERNFTRSELVQIGLAVGSILLSGAALYISTKK